MITKKGRNCTFCGVFKLWNEFYDHPTGVNGKQPKCKKCFCGSKTSLRVDKKGRACTKCLIYKPWDQFSLHETGLNGKRARCKVCLRAKNNAVSCIYKYDVSPEWIEYKLKFQDGKCEICGNKCIKNVSLSVDHDHETGKVRGLLCHNCNTGLGYYYDNPETLRRAATYLEKYQ